MRAAIPLAALALICARAAAQDPPLPPAIFDRPVLELQIEAPERFERAELRRALEIREGDLLERRALRRAVKRLYLVGQVEDVQIWAEPRDQGVVLRVRVVPARLVKEVRIQGAAGLAEQELREALGVAPGDRLEKVNLRASADAVRRLYATRGYLAAEVQIDQEEDEKLGEVVVRVEIDAGPPTRVAAMQFDADSWQARRDLRRWIDMAPGAIYDGRALADDLRGLQRRDRQRGYLEAQAPLPELSPEGEDALRVRLNYRRGPRYRASFRGVHALPLPVLRELVQLEPDEELGEDSLSRWRGLIVSRYRRAGYPSVQVRAGLAPGSAPGTRRLLFRVDEGPRAELDAIQVEGGQGELPRELAEVARTAVTDAFEEESALSPLDPGDLQGLLGAPPGRPRPQPGVEYPMGLARAVVPERVYDEAAYRDAARPMEDYCLSQGYLGAQVQGPRPLWRNDGREVVASYRLDAGEQTRVASVRFRGNQAFSAMQLLEALEFLPGAPLDLGKVEEARLRLLERYADAGHAFARVFAEVFYDEDRRQAEVGYRVEEGPEVRIGRILVQGNERTAAAVILDRLLLGEDDRYAASKIDGSRQRLLGLGLFTSVSLALIDPDRPEPIKDLRVDVRERMPRVFEFNLGASVEDGPRTSMLLEHRNLLGLGLGARGRFKLNYPRLTYFTIADPEVRERLERRFDLEYPGLEPSVRSMLFTEGQAALTVEYPKVFGLPIDTAGHSSLVALRENRSSFTLNKIGFLVGFDLRPWRFLSMGTAVELEGTDFLCYAEVAGRYQTCGRDEGGLTRRQDTGQLGQLTLRQEAVVDQRDNPFRPHAGYHLAGVADLAFGGGVLYGESGIGPGRVTTPVSSNFVKLASSASGYLPLTSSLTLALQARVGNIFGLSEQEHVPLYKKFFLGGTGSVRGFDEDRVLPADEVARIRRKLLAGTYSNERAQYLLAGSSSGGRFFWNLRSELRFPVSREVDLGLFLDAGELLESASELDLSQFSAGGGVGARWNTPVGPIALDLGVAMKDPALALQESLRGSQGLFGFEDRAKIHLSIGYF